VVHTGIAIVAEVVAGDVAGAGEVFIAQVFGAGEGIIEVGRSALQAQAGLGIAAFFSVAEEGIPAQNDGPHADTVPAGVAGGAGVCVVAF